MNKDILKGKWSEVKGSAKKRWGKLTNNDTMVVSGKKEELVGTLQTKYGHSKDKAEGEYKTLMKEKE